MVRKAAKKVIGKKAMKKTKGGHYNCSDITRQQKPSGNQRAGYTIES